MNWKDTLSLIGTIGGIAITCHYGFRHYVMKEDHYEWENRDDIEKMIFFMITSPIWLIVGIFSLSKWLLTKNPFCMTVEDIFELPGHGPIISGTIEKGSIRKGNKLKITDQGMTFRATCVGIEHNRQLVKKTKEGEVVG